MRHWYARHRCDAVGFLHSGRLFRKSKSAGLRRKTRRDCSGRVTWSICRRFLARAFALGAAFFLAGAFSRRRGLLPGGSDLCLDLGRGFFQCLLASIQFFLQYLAPLVGLFSAAFACALNLRSASRTCLASFFSSALIFGIGLDAGLHPLISLGSQVLDLVDFGLAASSAFFSSTFSGRHLLCLELGGIDKIVPLIAGVIQRVTEKIAFAGFAAAAFFPGG